MSTHNAPAEGGRAAANSTDSSPTGNGPGGRSRWPFIITGMLLGHVGAMALAVNIASGDSGHAVLPEYYQRAVDWDAQQQALVKSDALGWGLSATVAALRAEDGTRAVRLELTDRAWQPVTGARVELRIWHHAVGDVVTVFAAESDVPGTYVASAPMDRAGIWQCETTATRGDERFVDDRELTVVSLVGATDPAEGH